MTVKREEKIYKGIAASPGIAIGTVLVMGSKPLDLDIEKTDIKTTSIQDELGRFREALAETRVQLQELKEKTLDFLKDESAIFEAHLLIVDDKALIRETESFIEKQLVVAEYAFAKTIERYISLISMVPDQYIRERSTDIEDVAARILANIKNETLSHSTNIPGQRIIIAHDLTPSMTVSLDRENVQAFVTGKGSRTSHTAILARSMKIPAVVGVLNLLKETIFNGDLIIIDGFVGKVIINPNEETQNFYARKELKEEKYFANLLSEKKLRPETLDGYSIQIAANIDSLKDIDDVTNYGATGIGLFRTEYLYMNSNEAPSEENQFEIYKKVAESMKNNPVVIRTSDLGGDKLIGSNVLHTLHEQNPFLGTRAIRLSLSDKNIEVFKTQLRAILRASVFGDIKIMFPMICCVKEIDQVKEVLNEIKKELVDKKIPINENIEIGMMIETPAAAMQADVFAKKVDFFSIGTNDLVQYTLAVDRGNEHIAYLYQPAHPAVLRLMSNTILAAKTQNIWVSICGEMGGDLRYTPLLIGMGIHELSMSPLLINPIRKVIRQMKMYEAEDLVQRAMKCTTAEDVLTLSEEFLYKIAPDITNFVIVGE